jgi:non-ribosomal peptide synthase protein (TIGR01720 family)
VPFFPAPSSSLNYPSLRVVFLSGDWIPVRLPEQVRAAFPSAQVIGLGGATEATVWSNCYPIGAVPEHWTSIPYGKPIQNAQYYILDSHLHPCPIGVPGGLYIGGECLCTGYINEAALTAEKFLPDPFSPQLGARLYCTGDQARFLADGNIEFLGRLDHQVKIRGFRIELGEIQSALSHHPGVQGNVVLAREDVPGEKRLVAYVVPSQLNEEQAALTVSDLRRYLQEQLPEYMVPSAFVLLESMPLTPNGKLDRAALPAPEMTRPALEQELVSPRNPVESLLASIWAEVLRLEQVGIHDNFFELGGDSILSIQVIARANQAGLRLAPKDLFQHQTIAELAAVVETAPRIAAEQGLVAGAVPLTPIQHWFFEQELAEPQHWNQALWLEGPPTLDPAVLEQALQHVLRQHDALRLCFTRTASGWYQQHADLDGTGQLCRFDLSRIPAGEQLAALEAKASELQVSLDLARGPLMRMGFFDLGPYQSPRLLWVIHHLVVDGVSWRILLEDLQTAYHFLSQSQPVRLPPKTTSFQHWATRLHALAQTAAVAAELPYWRTQLSASDAPLPLDAPATAERITEATLGMVEERLSVQETEALLHQVPHAYHTQITEILLAALLQTCAAWTGVPRLRVDLEGHGREDLFAEVDLSRTVGWFTSLFPLRLELAAQMLTQPGELLKAVKEHVRQVPEHGLGFGLLRYLCQEEALSTPLRAWPSAEISFNYLGQFDQVVGAGALWRLAQESAGPLRGGQNRRPYLLEVSALVVEGQLRVEWHYSRQVHRRETIEGIAQRYLEALRTLIAHCLSPEAGGFTPADFPEAGLSQKELDELLIELSERRE